MDLVAGLASRLVELVTSVCNDQRSTSCNEEREELARHNAWQLQKELFNTEGHDGDVEDTDFFKCYVPIKASVQGLAIHTQDRTYIVHSGASIHMLGIYSVSPKGDEGNSKVWICSGQSDCERVRGLNFERNRSYQRA